MSGELEKWRGGLPASLETMIERWRGQRELVKFSQRHEAESAEQYREPQQQTANHVVQPVTSQLVVPPGAVGELIWLPRLCAVTGEFWYASYIRNADRRFHFGETARLPRHSAKNLSPDAARLSEFINCSRECCPCCGATYRGWSGPVYCHCGSKVCFGRTTEDDYFRCCCGVEGQLHPVPFHEVGFTPTLHRRGQPGT
jgi:hypothetical protein